MPDRKYTVDELDRMRDAIHNRYPKDQSYVPAERRREIEDQLRTHILNGTTPEELESKQPTLHDDGVPDDGSVAGA